MAEVRDTINTLMEVLADEFKQILASDPDFYRGYSIDLTNERQFVKKKHAKPNYIYIVVKFTDGATDNLQQQRSVLINAVGEPNSVDVCQRLLHEFSQTFTVDTPAIDKGDMIIKQTFSTPMVMQNFNNIFEGYRTLFYMSGTFLVGFNINLISKIEWLNDDNEYENIMFLGCSVHYHAQVDPRSQYSSNDFTKSVALIRTFSLNIATYNTTVPYNKKVIDVMYGDASVDTKFTFKITYKDTSIGTKTKTLRLVDVDDDQRIRVFPTRSVSFTE